MRVLMLVLMLISLVMSARIPRAFQDEAIGFAAAYVAIPVVRRGFMVAAFRGRPMGRKYAQLLAWSCIAGAVWIGGAFTHGDARYSHGSPRSRSTGARRCMASRSPGSAGRRCAGGRSPAATSPSAISSSS